jgi:hypothetical protein
MLHQFGIGKYDAGKLGHPSFLSLLPLCPHWMDDVMDDVAHSSPSLHHLSASTLSRKRKANGEDNTVQECPPTPEPMVVDTQDCLPRIPSRSCWPSTSHSNIWSPSSPSSSFLSNTHSSLNIESQREHKRPRIQHAPSGCPRRTYERRTGRATSEVIDMGVVSAARPGPSKGSLLRSSHRPSFLPTIDWSSPNIPSSQPIPNRDTLKELDLEAILRNPQLRKFMIVIFVIVNRLTSILRP